MKGSEWEAVRNSNAKRNIVSFLIAILVIIFSGIFYYNNRDFFKGTSENVISEQLVIVSDTSNNSAIIIDSGTINISTLISDSSSDSILNNKPEIKSVNKESSNPVLKSSLILTKFECRTFDRNDLRLLMSIELLCSVEKSEREIFLMRNDIKIVIQQLIRGMELSSIKEGILKPLIIRSVNDMVGSNFFIDLKIIDFKIEKVTKK